VFSVLRSVILRPFTWAPADRVMMIAEQDSAANVRPASYPTFQDWRSGMNAFEALAFVRGQGAVLKTGETPSAWWGPSLRTSTSVYSPSPRPWAAR
jgi:hypothetical protein